MNVMKRRASFNNPWVQIILAAILLGFLGSALYHSDFSAAALWESISKFGLPTLAGALFFVTAQNLLIMLRFWVLLPKRTVRFFKVANAMLLGQWLNLFLPARAGDALKVIWLNRDDKFGKRLPAATGAGILFADKIVDVTAWVVLMIVLGTQRFIPKAVVPSTPFVLTAMAVIVALMAVGIAVRQKIKRRFQAQVDLFFSALRSCRSPRIWMLSVLVGLGVWLSEAIGLSILIHRLGFTSGIAEAYAALVILNVAVALPIGIAGSGAYEAALAFALTALGVDTVPSLAIALVHHFLQILNTSLAALAVFLLRPLNSVESSRQND